MDGSWRENQQPAITNNDTERLLPVQSPQTYRRWLSLLGGGLAHALLGTNFIFYTYINDIKSKFNYNQKEVELLAAMLNTGIGLGFLPNLLGKQMKSRWILLIGMALSVTGSLLLWSSSKMVAFYSKHSWLMGLYYLIMGVGGSVAYIMSLRYNATHFDESKRGLVIAAMFVFIDVGMLTFSIIFYQAFTTQTRFENIMLVSAVYGVAVYIYCIAFLKSSFSIEQEVVPFSDTSGQREEYEPIDNSKPLSIPLSKLVCTLDYHLLAWLCSSLFSVSMVLSNNMTVLTKVLDKSHFDVIISILYPLVVIFGALTFSVISDKAKRFFSRVSFLMAGGVFMATASFLNTISGETATVFIAIILGAIGTGVVYTLGPAAMSELFHIEDLMRNWGLVMFLRAALVITGHLVFGAFYDMESGSDVMSCQGIHCTRYGYVVNLLVAVLAFVLGLVLNIRRNNGLCNHE